MSRSKILFSAFLLAMLIGPGASISSETQKSKAGAIPAGEMPECLKKVSAAGRPHRINSVASLGAVRAWTQQAMKRGELYGMWHNAKNPTINCEKLPRSDYYVCYAKGKPCRATHPEKTAANKAQ